MDWKTFWIFNFLFSTWFRQICFTLSNYNILFNKIRMHINKKKFSHLFLFQSLCSKINKKAQTFYCSLKFIYSEKATKFCEIFLLLWLCVLQWKLRGRFRKILWPSQNIWTLTKHHVTHIFDQHFYWIAGGTNKLVYLNLTDVRVDIMNNLHICTGM